MENNPGKKYSALITYSKPKPFVCRGVKPVAPPTIDVTF